MSRREWAPKDVFIGLGEALKALGLTVWFDAALEPGASFDEEIAREVSSARAVVVCWSTASVRARWVRSEAMIAARRNVLVPLFLEPSELPPPFNLDHAEDLSDWDGSDAHEGWQKILARIGALTGRGDALIRWVAARAQDRAKAYRAFLKDYPSDPLTLPAKERIWSLECEAMRQRLSEELGIAAPPDPTVQAQSGRRRHLRSAAAHGTPAGECSHRMGMRRVRSILAERRARRVKRSEEIGEPCGTRTQDP